MPVGRRVLVIGGCGNMGRWFVRYLGAQGFTVEVADPVGEFQCGVDSRIVRRSLPAREDLVLVQQRLVARLAR